MAVSSIIIGYIIGAISPSYFLGKLLKGIDIRKHGDGNAGTTNTKKVLGWGPAIITAIYDLSKGLIAMLIAYYLGADTLIIYLAGFSAVIGHIFPFYLGFKGGQGAATAVGILFLNIYLLSLINLVSLVDILALGVLALGILVITKRGEITGLVVLPIFAYVIIKNYDFDEIAVYTLIIIFFLFCLEIYCSWKRQLLGFSPKFKKKVKFWRFITRPLALIFPIILLNYGQQSALYLVGIVLIFFALWDVYRLIKNRGNITKQNTGDAVFKSKERKSFSSMTFFLLSSFLIIWLFPISISVTSLCFLILGDMAAKFFGIQYGKTELFNKTMEGSIGFFIISFVVGYFLLSYLPNLTIIMMLIGAITATLIEVLPIKINDNLTIGISSALIMLLISIL